MKEFLEELDNICDEKEAHLRNVLVLAFVGDGLWTAYVRAHLAKNTLQNSGKLNKIANIYVKAESQAIVYDELAGVLTEKELDVGKRARNSKLHHTAKNASIETYRQATSYESVLGYVFMSGNIERLNNLMRQSVKIVEEKIIKENICK